MCKISNTLIVLNSLKQNFDVLETLINILNPINKRKILDPFVSYFSLYKKEVNYDFFILNTEENLYIKDVEKARFLISKSLKVFYDITKSFFKENEIPLNDFLLMEDLKFENYSEDSLNNVEIIKLLNSSLITALKNIFKYIKEEITENFKYECKSSSEYLIQENKKLILFNPDFNLLS